MTHRLPLFRLRTLVLLVGIVLLLPSGRGPVQGADDTPSEAATRAAVLERLARASRGIVTIESEFLQESHTGMLAEPLRSQGRFRFEAPDRLHWEVVSPERFGFSMKGEEVETWRGSSTKAEKTPPGAAEGIRHFADQLFAWVRADFAWLEKRFDLYVAGDDPVVLELKPLSSKAAERMAVLRVSFSEDLDHVKTIEIEETGGDRMVITFVNTSVRRE